MQISLDQAIEIHARVLRYWHRDRAPEEARERALDCATTGDFEGFQAWAKVAKLCEALGAVDRSRAVDPPVLICEAEAAGPITDAMRPFSKAPEPWRPIHRE